MDSLIKKTLNENINKILKEQLDLSNIQYLYHATPSCYFKSIKKYGLGGKVPQIRLWNYENTEYDKISVGCFLATDEYVAESYVETSDFFDELCDYYGEELDIIVFQINVNDLKLNLLKIDTNQMTDDENTYFYGGIIPFNKLKIIKLY